MGSTIQEERRRQSVVDKLKMIGIKRGVLHTMARAGQLVHVRCETPRCYRDEGRDFPEFELNSPWSPTVDHYPTLKSNCGYKDPWNVRLAHKMCNNEDFAWRAGITRMIKQGKSLQEMADELNRQGVATPRGSFHWTAASVRWNFVTS